MFSIKDAMTVRNQLQDAIVMGLQEALQTPLHVRVLSSDVTHGELLPEGDTFDIRFRVEVHPKKEKKDTE